MRVFLQLVMSVTALSLPGCERRPLVDGMQSRSPVDREAGAVDAGSSPVASAPTATPASDPCVVAQSAERTDLRSCYVDTLPEPEWDVASSIEITASPATVTNTPGGIGDLVVRYANKTAAPVVLVFDDSPLRGHVVAYRADGRPADGTEAPPPAAMSAGAKAARSYERITLGPKAVLDERKMWFASSWIWTQHVHEKQYPRTLLGPLPKGTYTLRVRTPLVVRFTSDRMEYAETSTTGAVE